jgi:hypothetical protein
MGQFELKLKGDKPWVHPEDMRVFRRAREKGMVSFFRTAACQECHKEIPKHEDKTHCSKSCWELTQAKIKAQQAANGESLDEV